MKNDSKAQTIKKIAIIGGGPSCLFVVKKLVESNFKNVKIEVFEKKKDLGSGMPYSEDGARVEHITNVSGNEIPELMTPLSEWIGTLKPEVLKKFNINANYFNDFNVLPRLLFGQYLCEQFRLLELKARDNSIPLKIHRKVFISDIIDDTKNNRVKVLSERGKKSTFDYVIICTGHHWPQAHEGRIKGYFDSPYPPSKLALKINHPVAIRGASLSAVDAVRTLARQNGVFISDQDGNISFNLDKESNGFKIVLHSRKGMLPAVRFHLEDSHLGKDAILTPEEIENNKLSNEGFLSLDFVFTKSFKTPLKINDPEFYAKIERMNLEEFVQYIMAIRKSFDAFDFFRGEYIEAEISIQRKESIYWKEKLGVLSFVMNHPAKYFSAEDTLRLQRILHPLLSIVIAYVPQSSVEEMLALHESGFLDFISAGDESYVEPVADGGAIYCYFNNLNEKISIRYQTYIDATGQRHLTFNELPFKSLLNQKTVSSAKIKFRDPVFARKERDSGNQNVIMDEKGCYLNVPGIAINDNFQVLNEYGASNSRIYVMAVPYIGGFNPDYSGLDFCEAASKYVVEGLLKDIS